MPRIALILSLLLAVFTVTAAPALAAETGIGTVQGQVVNGTTGGSSVANHEVTLKTYQNDNETSLAATMTDAEGYFSFTGVKVEPDYEYQVTLFFQTAAYESERTTFGEGEDTKTITIHVFDATTSDKNISIATAHTIIYPGQDSLSIKEYFLFLNDSDRTYVGPAMKPDETGVLQFSLPQEATGLQPSLGLTEHDILNTGDGFADTVALLPGMREVAFTYQVPYQFREYLFTIRVNYPLDNYDLLVQETKVMVSSTELLKGEPLTISDSQFQHFSGRDFIPQDKIEVQLGSSPASGSGNITWFAAILLVIIIAVSLGYLWTRRRTRPLPAPANPAPSGEKLLQEIARLDDAFESGKIIENDYRSQRAEIKQQLVKLMTDIEKKV